MGSIIYEDSRIKFEGIISENEVAPMREHLNLVAPNVIDFDFVECKDLHTSILQIIVAYKGLYKAKFSFAEEPSTYQKMLEGFYLSDNDIN